MTSSPLERNAPGQNKPRKKTKKEELFKRSHKQRQPPSSNDEAKKITQSLLRTKRLMKQELERVCAVSDTIDSDRKTFSEIRDDNLSLGGIVSSARGALKNLRSLDTREAVVFNAAVIWFFSVASYVFWTRVRIPFLLW